MDESTGATLKQTREQRHLTVQQVAEKTKIRPRYLEALENDDFAAMPSAAQARGFLRIYADFLALDVRQLVAAGRPVDSGPGTLPSPTLVGADHQDAAAQPRTSPPGLFSILRDLWSRRGGRNAVGASGADSADRGDAADASSRTSASSDSPGGELLPGASDDDPDEAKKKALN